MNKILFFVIIFISIGCNRAVYVLPNNLGSDIVNHKGKTLFTADFFINDFSNGLAEFSDTIRKKNGCIKKNGKIAFLCDDYFIKFYEGLACINKDDTLYFINKRGNVVLTPKYRGKNLNGPFYNWSYFSEGLAVMIYPISDDTSTYVFIDKKGNVHLDNHFLYADNFKNGLALVQFKDSTLGYINKKGRKKIILASNLSGESFYEGIARVYDSDSCFFIKKNGRKISEKKYLSAEHFQNGRAIISIKINGISYYGFINRSGEKVIEPQYQRAVNFSNGLASVERKINDDHASFETYIINKNGKILFGPYKNIVISEFESGIAKGWTKDLSDYSVEYFLINKKGKMIYSTKIFKNSNGKDF